MSGALTRHHETMNVQQPTSNVQRRTGLYSLNGECWLFDVRIYIGTLMSGALTRHHETMNFNIQHRTFNVKPVCIR